MMGEGKRDWGRVGGARSDEGRMHEEEGWDLW